MNFLTLGFEIAVYPAGTLLPQALAPKDTIPTCKFLKFSGPPESPTQLSEPTVPAQILKVKLYKYKEVKKVVRLSYRHAVREF